MKRKFVFAAVFASALSSVSAFAGENVDEIAEQATPEIVVDIAAGEKRYMRECRACHGREAQGVSSFPKLVGPPPEYIVERLEQYRAGEKLGPNTPLMAPLAKNLSDEEIANLAGFIASLSE